MAVSVLLKVTVCACMVHFAVAGRLLLGSQLTYHIVSTNQTQCFSDASVMLVCPAPGADFSGQDAQTKASAPASYSVSSNGLTVTDKVTGLTWMHSADINGDGRVDSKDKLPYVDAKGQCQKLSSKKYAGYNDWRLPSIKELYSLITFTGTDPVPTSNTTAGLKPFISTPAFKFSWGDLAAGERVIDAQYASATTYVNDPKKVFGVNFADGRIKGYDSQGGPIGDRILLFYVLCVRGNTAYGRNAFKDNGDGTVTDSATGLIWDKKDSGKGMPWKQALSWVEARNKENYLGHSDWRLPSVKELQSLVDYSRSPDTSSSPALDPVFDATAITNEAGLKDWGYVWSGTTHVSTKHGASYASYVSFGRCLGYITSGSTGQTGPTVASPVSAAAAAAAPTTAATTAAAASKTAEQTTTKSKSTAAAAGKDLGWTDVHGAGCQRSDPKSGDPKVFPQGSGPQGDAIRINNFVRLVRGSSEQ